MKNRKLKDPERVTQRIARKLTERVRKQTRKEMRLAREFFLVDYAGSKR